MIDIMMFLLVFFILITLRMIAGTGIQLDLPFSSTPQPLTSVKVTIGVKKDGTMFVEGKPITAPALKGNLQQLKQANKVDVVIAGDKAVSLQTLLNVMDIVRSAGINAVGIATKPEEPSSS
jgi:biopolymer transport protein ExbD